EYKEIPVYWCEKLGTVLANEEIKNIAGQKLSERGNYPKKLTDLRALKVYKKIELGLMKPPHALRNKESKEINGEFTGSYCQNPLTGGKLPIWITNFVINEYGTGAVMINAFSPEIFEHQEISNLVNEKELKQNKQIDYAFARKYQLPIKKIFQINKQEEKAVENDQQELLSEKDLPLTLPPLTDFAPNPHYYSPLQKAENWVNVENESGLKGKRDVNVMPQSPRNNKKLITVLAKIGLVLQPEPFQKLICQGMILGEDGEKMSKSRGNIVNPDPLITKYGADALRLAIIFLAPPEQTTSFKSESIRAMNKWLKRVYQLFTTQQAKFIDNSNPE
ncbi:2234_t:CDS:2, partial [Funneliformis geosporum]